MQTDYDLIVQKNVEGIITKYNPLIKSKTYSYYTSLSADNAVEYEDVYMDMVEQTINLCHKIKLERISSKFKIGSLLERRLAAYLKASHTKKKNAMYKHSGDIVDHEYESNSKSPEEIFFDGEVLENYEKFKGGLSKKEITILKMLEKNVQIKDIAKKMKLKDSTNVCYWRKQMCKKYKAYIS